jgi:hypothetical protein
MTTFIHNSYFFEAAYRQALARVAARHPAASWGALLLLRGAPAAAPAASTPLAPWAATDFRAPGGHSRHPSTPYRVERLRTSRRVLASMI